MTLSHVKDIEVKELFKFLFSIKNEDPEEFNSKLGAYLNELTKTEESAKNFKQAILNTINSVFFTDSLTNAGINSNMGFFPELKQRIKNRILPQVNNENHFSHFVTDTFDKRNDYKIFEKFSHENLSQFVSFISTDDVTRRSLKSQLENALIILAHRLVTIGIDPYIVGKLNFTDDSDSPFFKFNIAINNYVRGIGSIDEVELYLNRCEEVFQYFKDKRDTLGISLHLTFLIRRADQHIKRIQLLLKIHAAKTNDQLIGLVKELLVKIIQSELYNTSIIGFFRENTDLLANRVANQTSSKGGYYIGTTRESSKKLFRSALGGGLIVVLLVYFKNYIHELHLALLPEGLLFGLNYGLGFVAMHLLHFTLATKQPAMTASYIAGVIEQKGGANDSRIQISLVLAQIMRSQFVSLIGNLVVVLPLCFITSWLLFKLFGFHVFSETEVVRQMYGNHPFYSASLFFAVVTGAYLTLAGLINGYYDNKVMFSRIPERIVKHPLLKKAMSKSTLEKTASFIAKNLGALAGNMALGMFLGITGNFGKFLGIPIDIRHITISAGNFGIATAQGYSFPLSFVLTVFAGVLLIGLINIISSFMFSYYIACRSRYMSNKQITLVFLSMIGHIIRNPSTLILPKDVQKKEGH